MTLRDNIINHIIDVEGGYVNDPRDSGGETNYGITKTVAINNGYTGDMRNFPKSLAFKIYTERYWNSMMLDDIEKIAGEKIAGELADTGVNMGVSRASEFLQRSLNVLNKGGVIYNDLVVDGYIGNATLNALSKFKAYRQDDGMLVLYRMLNALQGEFYVKLAERRAKDEEFIFGWFSNRVS